MHNWISVTERLPEKPKHDWVLVATMLVPEERRGVPHIAELRNGVWYAQDSEDVPLERHFSVRVTHWMPITPETPEIETNEPLALVRLRGRKEYFPVVKIWWDTVTVTVMERKAPLVLNSVDFGFIEDWKPIKTAPSCAGEEAK